MTLKFYKKNIIEGKGFLSFSIVSFALLKCVHFFNVNESVFLSKESGYLWDPIAPFFETPIYSAIASCVLILFISFLLSSINLGHVLIRKRTFLPSAIVILLFSCIPIQLAMSASYIGVLAMIFVVDALFQAYNSEQKAFGAFKASFYLSLGSLFSPVLLIYFPVIWICLARVRSFGFKSFLSSLFSIFLLYLPVLSYYLIVEDDMSRFLQPFENIISIDWALFPILSFKLYNFIILGVAVLLVVLILIDNIVNSFKDKIQVRALLSVLSILSIFSLLAVLFLNIDTTLFFYVVLAVGSLQLGHFFTLIQSKYLPYFFLSLLISLIVISFMSVTI